MNYKKLLFLALLILACAIAFRDESALATASPAGSTTVPVVHDDDDDDDEDDDDDDDDDFKLVVDDDKVQCPNAQFTRIQDAVNAADPNDKIRVCPGTYTENVVVNKLGLRIKGSGGSPRKRTGDPQKEAILDGSNLAGSGFDLRANGVTIRRMTVQNFFNGSGILTLSTVSGFNIRRNLIQFNSRGITLNTPTTSAALETTIRKNFFKANNVVSDPSSGYAIFSDQGARNVNIEHNDFTLHEEATIFFSGASNSFLMIKSNRLFDDNTIVLFNTADSSIKANDLLRVQGTGIFLGGNNKRVLIEDNDINDNFNGPGISITNPPSSVPNTLILVRSNKISDVSIGINLNNAMLNAIENNKIEEADSDGIRLSNADKNLFKNNKVMKNGRDGIRADAASAENRIESNTILGNVEHDAHDDSVGSRTAGTANFWIKNNCMTENRPGLCKK